MKEGQLQRHENYKNTSGRQTVSKRSIPSLRGALATKQSSVSWIISRFAMLTTKGAQNDKVASGWRLEQKIKTRMKRRGVWLKK